MKIKTGQVTYNKTFRESVDELKKAAHVIIKVEEELNKAEVSLKQQSQDKNIFSSKQDCTTCATHTYAKHQQREPMIS